MAINNITVGVIARQNTNRMSAAYGKWYYTTDKRQTLSNRGFLQHIQDHGLAIPRSVAQACLSQITSCLRELLLQGVPVKLDGLGTITPTISSTGALNKEDCQKKVRSNIKGVHFRLIPDNTELDSTTSTTNLAKASLQFNGLLIAAEGHSPSINGKESAVVSKEVYQKLNP